MRIGKVGIKCIKIDGDIFENLGIRIPLRLAAAV